jgi:hypothetical protein
MDVLNTNPLLIIPNVVLLLFFFLDKKECVIGHTMSQKTRLASRTGNQNFYARIAVISEDFS